MTLNDLIQRVSQKLDENVAFYPYEDIVRNGINPAQRLIAVQRRLLSRRAALTVNAASVLIDLRQVAPRLWKLRRVVLGDTTSDDPVTSIEGYRPLRPTDLTRIWSKSWFLDTGLVSQYWTFGEHWIGLYKRPQTDTTITLIYDAIPLAFTESDITENPAKESELPDTYHPLICDVAHALLIMREGIGETAKAENILSQTFGQELTKGLRRLTKLQLQPQGAA